MLLVSNDCVPSLVGTKSCETQKTPKRCDTKMEVGGKG